MRLFAQIIKMRQNDGKVKNEKKMGRLGQKGRKCPPFMRQKNHPATETLMVYVCV
jgi:hypothetical protein